MNKPHHLVFGAGLIGGYIAGGLINAGFKTSLVARERAREAMRNGLIISDFLGNKTKLETPHFIDTNTAEDQTIKFLWLTVKCTSISSITDDLRNHVSDKTIIICCQNGLESDQIIRDAFPENTVLRAIIGFNVAEPKAGTLHRSTDGKFVIESNDQITQIAKILNTPLLPVVLSDNIVAEQWAKLQLNLANPVNALADIPVKEMTEDAGYRKIIAALMLELLAVANAMKIDLPKVTAVPAHWIPSLMMLPNWIFKLLAQKMLAIDPTARASMWWDLSTGRKTEIEFLNGAVVRKGATLGVACPINQKLVELIHQVEAGEHSIGFSANQLESILFEQDENA